MTGDDWVKIIGAVGTSTVVIIAAMTALLVQLRQYRHEVNGKMDQLLDVTRTAARAEGQLAGPDTPRRRRHEREAF